VIDVRAPARPADPDRSRLTEVAADTAKDLAARELRRTLVFFAFFAVAVVGFLGVTAVAVVSSM
jgi:hypothetical protein